MLQTADLARQVGIAVEIQVKIDDKRIFVSLPIKFFPATFVVRPGSVKVVLVVELVEILDGFGRPVWIELGEGMDNAQGGCVNKGDACAADLGITGWLQLFFRRTSGQIPAFYERNGEDAAGVDIQARNFDNGTARRHRWEDE